jgi:hypothetical protein
MHPHCYINQRVSDVISTLEIIDFPGFSHDFGTLYCFLIFIPYTAILVNESVRKPPCFLLHVYFFLGFFVQLLRFLRNVDFDFSRTTRRYVPEGMTLQID